jgi:hypothetical protein
MASKTVVFKKFDDSILVNADVSSVGTETSVCSGVLNAFDNGTDVVAYFGSPYVAIMKNYANASLADPAFTIVTTSTNFTLSETEITYWQEVVTTTDPAGSAANSYSGIGTSDKAVYEVMLTGVLANGGAVVLDEAYLTKTYNYASTSATTGVVTYDTGYSISYTDQGTTPTIGGYKTFQMYGDGYIAYEN